MTQHNMFSFSSQNHRTVGALERGNAALVVVAVIAVIALLLAWAAFNRSGQDVTTEISQGVDTVAEETALFLARAEARADLLALRARLTTQEGYEAAQEELTEIRAELRVAYENAGEAFAQEWQDIQQDFAALEIMIREGSADVLDAIADLVERLERDVRTDEQ